MRVFHLVWFVALLIGLVACDPPPPAVIERQPDLVERVWDQVGDQQAVSLLKLPDIHVQAFAAVEIEQHVVRPLLIHNPGDSRLSVNPDDLQTTAWPTFRALESNATLAPGASLRGALIREKNPSPAVTEENHGDRPGLNTLSTADHVHLLGALANDEATPTAWGFEEIVMRRNPRLADHARVLSQRAWVHPDGHRYRVEHLEWTGLMVFLDGPFFQDPDALAYVAPGVHAERAHLRSGETILVWYLHPPEEVRQ